MKTRLFIEPNGFGDNIDDQINDFLKENNVEVIDIKLSQDSRGLTVALLLYREPLILEIN